MQRTVPLVLVLLAGCAGRAPGETASTEVGSTARVAAAPAAPAAPASRPGTSPPAAEGRKVWELIPDAPHGRCCTTDDECGPITCEPYEYAHASCQRVCTYSCEPGDLCPVPGGTLGPPSPCPESGLCPVGSPFV